MRWRIPARGSCSVIARAQADSEVAYLDQHGASIVVMSEQETARGMIDEGMKLTGSAPAPA